MKIESVTMAGSPLQSRPSASEKVDEQRKEAKDVKAGGLGAQPGEAKLAKEEILDAIKALTEDGLYSVRFEKHKATDDLVIKLVDEQGELIRQIPAEEVLNLSQKLQDLRGNVIKAES
jgi:flagellar protein FlaG